MTDQPFCVLPWFHQVVKTNGEVKPCCQWKKSIPDYDAATFFNGKFMNELRESFKNNIPHNECRNCIYVEKTGNRSHRQLGFIRADMLKITDVPKLLSQEVRLSNLCNLKCRMCNQKSSTKWIADEIAMGHKSVGLLESNWSLSIEQVNTVELLTFTGGEPMLHQDILCKELTKLKNANRLNLLILTFNTNMTIEISDELIELFKQTKGTYICCSIDGVGKINEYIRSDTIWSDVEKNMNIFYTLSKNYNNIFLSTNSVYNVFSAESFTELMYWISQYTDMVTILLQNMPAIQDARNLPMGYKNKLIKKYEIDLQKCSNSIIAEKYKIIINHLQNTPTINYDIWKKRFKIHNDFLDQRRHVNLVDVLPELADIINS